MKLVTNLLLLLIPMTAMAMVVPAPEPNENYYQYGNWSYKTIDIPFAGKFVWIDYSTLYDGFNIMVVCNMDGGAQISIDRHLDPNYHTKFNGEWHMATENMVDSGKADNRFNISIKMNNLNGIYKALMSEKKIYLTLEGHNKHDNYNVWLEPEGFKSIWKASKCKL